MLCWWRNPGAFRCSLRARNQRPDIGHPLEQRKATGARDEARLPMRRELVLIGAQAAKAVEALAMVSEVIHGAPYRFSDPARFSLAHGGKDRHPFPVPLKVYDQTLNVLRDAMTRAKLGQDERLSAIERLDRQARALQRTPDAPSFAQHLDTERARSADYGGMSVFGPEPPTPVRDRTPIE